MKQSHSGARVTDNRCNFVAKFRMITGSGIDIKTEIRCFDATQGFERHGSCDLTVFKSEVV